MPYCVMHGGSGVESTCMLCLQDKQNQLLRRQNEILERNSRSSSGPANLSQPVKSVVKILETIIMVVVGGGILLGLAMGLFMGTCGQDLLKPEAAAQVVVVVDEENVRQGPGGKVIAKVKRGEQLPTRVATDGLPKWVSVLCCGGKSGYIWADSVQPAPGGGSEAAPASP